MVHNTEETWVDDQANRMLSNLFEAGIRLMGEVKDESGMKLHYFTTVNDKYRVRVRVYKDADSTGAFTWIADCSVFDRADKDSAHPFVILRYRSETDSTHSTQRFIEVSAWKENQFYASLPEDLVGPRAVAGNRPLTEEQARNLLCRIADAVWR